MTPGYAFSALNIQNPLGFVLQHKFKELRVIRKNIAADIGCDVAYLSQMMAQDKKPVSFMTDCGERLIEELMKIEKNRSDHLTASERHNFKRYSEQFYHGAMLLSFYQNTHPREKVAHSFFHRMVKFGSEKHYKTAMRLVGEAILSQPSTRVIPRTGLVASSPIRRPNSFKAAIRSQKRSWAERLYDFDTHPDREMIFTMRGLPLISNQRAAFEAICDALDGLDEEKCVA